MSEKPHDFDKPGDKAFWVKCTKCDHCWAAAFWPIECTKFCTLIKRACCPKCAAKGKYLVIPKQEDGILLEASK